MLIRLGFEVALDFIKPAAVVLMTYVHPSQQSKIRKPERFSVQPHVPVGPRRADRCRLAAVL